ncbi:MAG: hypothetical protein R3B74_15825 [Nitrospirales bacterium]|nr:hypothetical protein [Nitrospirales bacterium]
MVETDEFVKELQGIGFDFFTGVPDTILGGIIAHLTEEGLYTPAVREDEAVAMASGLFLGGKIPAVLMQNSGLGNALNVLASFEFNLSDPLPPSGVLARVSGKRCPRAFGHGTNDDAIVGHRENSTSDGGSGDVSVERSAMGGEDIYGATGACGSAVEKRHCKTVQP